MSLSGRKKPCPKCGAKAGEPCRTLRTRRVTDEHKARWLDPVQEIDEAFATLKVLEDSYRRHFPDGRLGPPDGRIEAS